MPLKENQSHMQNLSSNIHQYQNFWNPEKVAFKDLARPLQNLYKDKHSHLFTDHLPHLLSKISRGILISKCQKVRNIVLDVIIFEVIHQMCAVALQCRKYTRTPIMKVRTEGKKSGKSKEIITFLWPYLSKETANYSTLLHSGISILSTWMLMANSGHDHSC